EKLAFADVGGGNDALPALGEAAGNDRPGRGRQAAQLFQGVAAEPGTAGQGDSDEKSPFPVDGQFVAGNVERHVGWLTLLPGFIVSPMAWGFQAETADGRRRYPRVFSAITQEIPRCAPHGPPA